MKSLLSAIIVLGIAASVALFSYQPKVSLPTIHHDPRFAALATFMRVHNFALDQYQYVSEIIKDADASQIPAGTLVCIDLQESSGGKRYYRPTHNPFGWGSDQISFTSERIAIDYISSQLGDGPAYTGKTIEGKIRAYNPSPTYEPAIMRCLSQIPTIN